MDTAQGKLPDGNVYKAQFEVALGFACTRMGFGGKARKETVDTRWTGFASEGLFMH